MGKAIDIYYNQNNEYPSAVNWTSDANNELLNPPSDQKRLINSIPLDTFNGTTNKISYDMDTTTPTYVAWSYGPDNNDNITGAGVDDFDAPEGDDIFVTNAKSKRYDPQLTLN
ncbi:MAG: hypothetical protein KAS70_04930 [Planctomycetes bacterium]|nr:hypothetical protein [Planctomycetota bacterium]